MFIIFMCYVYIQYNMIYKYNIYNIIYNVIYYRHAHLNIKYGDLSMKYFTSTGVQIYFTYLACYICYLNSMGRATWNKYSSTRC